MRILADLCHPAHVHFFRHAIAEWRSRGHEVQLVARDKDLTLPLLDHYRLAYTCLSRAGRGPLGLGLELLIHQARLYRLARPQKPHAILNLGGVLAVHAARLLGVPGLAFTDTEHARWSNAIAFPFATAVCTPACFEQDLGPRQVRYPGYHELAYLHPNRFHSDPQVPRSLGLDPGRFVVVRFVSWNAAHDIGHSGFSLDAKLELVRRLERQARVLITTEAPLPAELERCRLVLAPALIHDLLAAAALYVGEGATMASEAAVLGVPAVYVNPLPLGYLREQQERYGLVHCLTEPAAAMERAETLVSDAGARRRAQAGRERLLAEKIDVTAWLVEFVERYASVA